MPRPSRNPQGFSLIEAAVAIAVIAILASAAVPLVMKALNQQRERTTRDSLKVAFEAMLGARDRQVANMRSDFAFTPGGTLADLRQMTTRTPANLALWGTAGGTLFSWGWNGPYWTGAIRPQAGTNGLPIDAWGRLIRLDFVGGGFQVRSAGPDGILNTVDDLYYPSTPMPLTSATAKVKVSVNVYKVVGGVPLTQTIDSTSEITAWWPNDGPNPTTNGPSAVDANGNNFTPPPGPFQVTVKLGGTTVAPPNPVTQVISLLPGEQRTIVLNFTIN